MKLFVGCGNESFLGSIPIARSINLVDSVALPLLRLENGANWPEFWTQVGPKSSQGATHAVIRQLARRKESRRVRRRIRAYVGAAERQPH